MEFSDLLRECYKYIWETMQFSGGMGNLMGEWATKKEIQETQKETSMPRTYWWRDQISPFF